MYIGIASTGNDADLHCPPLPLTHIPSVDVLNPPSPQSQVPQTSVLTCRSPVPQIPKVNFQDVGPELTPLSLIPATVSNIYSRSHIDIMDNHFNFPAALPSLASSPAPTLPAQNMLIGPGLGPYPAGEYSLHHPAFQVDTNFVPNEDSTNHMHGPDHDVPSVHGPNMFAYCSFNDSHHTDPLTMSSGLASRGRFLTGPLGMVDGTSHNAGHR